MHTLSLFLSLSLSLSRSLFLSLALSLSRTLCLLRTRAHAQVLLLEGANVHAVDNKQMKPVNLANSKVFVNGQIRTHTHIHTHKRARLFPLLLSHTFPSLSFLNFDCALLSHMNVSTHSPIHMNASSSFLPLCVSWLHASQFSKQSISAGCLIGNNVLQESNAVTQNMLHQATVKKVRKLLGVVRGFEER